MGMGGGKGAREHDKLANLVAVGSLFKAPFKNALCQRPHARRGGAGVQEGKDEVGEQ